MLSRAGLISIVVCGATAISGCHKTAPPATQPAPVTAPTAASQSGQPATARSSAPQPSDSRPADDSRRKLAESMGEMIHFDYNEALLSADDKRTLDAKVVLLRANPAIHIRITGNCDDRGSDQYNVALGMRRAEAAKQYLAVAGIEAGRIEVSSLGREMPLDRSNTEAAWAKNRRDEFVITAGF